MRAPALSLVFVLCATLLAGCTQQAAWQAPHYVDHPLVGTIWRVADSQPITETTLMAELVSADYIILGETHDNPDHHRLQADIITGLKTLGRSPVVGFEMLSTSQSPALADHLAAHPDDSTEIGNAVGWERTGWPDWPLYEPIARAALDADLPLFAANADVAEIRQIARGEISGLSADKTRRLAIDVSIPDDITKSLSTEIDAAHCGYAPSGMIAGMVRAQWSRDAHMAAALIDAGHQNGAVLIAGTGHARRDRGVPFHLLRLQPGQHPVSVAFLEVSPTRESVNNYADAFNATAVPFDFVWFTPRIDAQDPCERFAEKLKTMQHTKNKDRDN
jgi:uncharacterized iron-regulated protein